jgi:hypothetical protein
MISQIHHSKETSITTAGAASGPAEAVMGRVDPQVRQTVRHALASLWELAGALIVDDAAAFQQIKRMPMRKPVGKHGVWNTITRSEGSSH